MRPLLALTLPVALLLAPRPATACTVCSAGDPTLTLLGSERSLAGRVRASADVRAGSARVGDVELDEQRLDLGVSYAPTEDVLLALSVPLLRRHVRAGARFDDVVLLPGDVEIRAKMPIKVLRHAPVEHRFSIQAGMKFPTAPLQKGEGGAPLPVDLQPGMGGFTPFAGLSYAVFDAPWSFHSSTTYYLPVPIRDGQHAAHSLRANAVVQLQPMKSFATRFGASLRLEGKGEGETEGTDAANSGGVLAYVSTEIVVGIVGDLRASAGGYFPVAQALEGDHMEGTIWTAGISYDF